MEAWSRAPCAQSTAHLHNSQGAPMGQGDGPTEPRCACQLHLMQTIELPLSRLEAFLSAHYHQLTSPGENSTSSQRTSRAQLTPQHSRGSKKPPAQRTRGPSPPRFGGGHSCPADREHRTSALRLSPTPQACCYPRQCSGPPSTALPFVCSNKRTPNPGSFYKGL